MIIALACGLHCAILTGLFLLYPTLWLKRRYWEIGLWQKLFWLEWVLLVTAWLLVLIAMIPGYLRHRHWGPGLLALTAAGMMTGIIATPLHFAGYWTSAVALLGGIGLVFAHAWNLRLLRADRCGPWQRSRSSGI